MTKHLGTSNGGGFYHTGPEGQREGPCYSNQGVGEGHYPLQLSREGLGLQPHLSPHLQDPMVRGPVYAVYKGLPSRAAGWRRG